MGWLIGIVASVLALAIAPPAPTTSNDGSHLALALALSEGRVALGGYAGMASIDHSERDGVIYSDRPPGLALLLVPLIWLGIDPRLLSAAAFGGTLIVLYGWMRRDGCTAAAAGAATLLAGTTLLLRFAPVLFAHSLTAFLLTVAARLVTGRTRHGWLLGLALGWAGITEYALALLSIAALLVAWRFWPSFYLGLAVPVGAAALYQWVAFGAPWYTASHFHASFAAQRTLSATFAGPLLPGLAAFVWTGTDAWGFRNYGLLAISPVLALAPLALFAYGVRFRWQAALLLVCSCAFLALYSTHVAFGAGTSNSRYFVPFLPLLLMGYGHLFTALGWPAAIVAGVLGLEGVRNLLMHIAHSDGWKGAVTLQLPF